MPRQNPFPDRAADQRAGEDVRGEVDMVVDARDGDAAREGVDDRRHDPAVVVAGDRGGEGEGVRRVAGWETVEILGERMKGVAPFIAIRPRAADGSFSSGVTTPAASSSDSSESRPASRSVVS